MSQFSYIGPDGKLVGPGSPSAGSTTSASSNAIASPFDTQAELDSLNKLIGVQPQVTADGQTVEPLATSIPLATADSPGAIANNTTAALTQVGDSLYVTAAQKSLVSDLATDLVIATPTVVAGGAVANLDHTFAVPAENAAVVRMAIVSAFNSNLGWNLRINGATAIVYGGQKRVGGTGTLVGTGSIGAAISPGTTGNVGTLHLDIRIGPVILGWRLCRTYGVDTGMILAVETIFLTDISAITSIGIEPASAGSYVNNGSTIFGNLSEVSASGV